MACCRLQESWFQLWERHCVHFIPDPQRYSGNCGLSKPNLRAFEGPNVWKKCPRTSISPLWPQDTCISGSSSCFPLRLCISALCLEALAGGTEYKLFPVHVQDPLPSPPALKVCSGGGSAPTCSLYLQETEVLPVGSLPRAATSSSQHCQENTALFHTVLVYLS